MTVIHSHKDRNVTTPLLITFVNAYNGLLLKNLFKFNCLAAEALKLTVDM